jgi:hypothetical protein
MHGSTEVRVGTDIFGKRDYSKKKPEEGEKDENNK